MVLQNNKQVSYSLGTHKGQAVIFIRFEYDRALIEETKKIDWRLQHAQLAADFPQGQNICQNFTGCYLSQFEAQLCHAPARSRDRPQTYTRALGA